MTNYTLDWTNAGSNGNYTVASGSSNVGVNIATNTNAGKTASVISNGSPSQEALWVSGLTEPVTTTMDFDAPVRELSFEVFDIDAKAGGWDDKLTIIAFDADGNQVPITFSDLDGVHSVQNGNILNADSNASSGVETVGATDSVTVNIAGPIVSLKFIFDNGESIDNSGTFGVSDIAFVSGPDFTVDGTAGNDLIDADYLDDPEGDMVDNNDAADGSNDDVIMAGAGNDTVFGEQGSDTIYGEAGDDVLYGGLDNDTLYGGDGNDTLHGNEGDDVFYGGAGADSIETGHGNDIFYGGDGNDRVNGDYGNDVLYGGAGDDWLRGSFGNDTFYSGSNEGDDYEWGGYGDDTFIVQDHFGNDQIDAEEEDEVNGDTIDMSGVTTDLTIDLTNGVDGNGSFTDGVDTTTFIDIENIILSSATDTVKLADGSGSDNVDAFEGPTDNGDGTFTGHDQLDVSGMTRDGGSTPVTTNDVVVSDDGNGNAVLTFPGGENITLKGIAPADLSTPAALEAIGIPPGTDGIVSGTAGNDFIFNGYTGDDDGDRIDNDDAHLPGETGDDDIVQAGAGDDTIYSGYGSDEDHGGTGNDTVFAGVGNDTVWGDAGDDDLYGEDGVDTIEGGVGNDTLTGGLGGDSLSGGDDSDIFLGGTDGDVVDGGEGGVDNDTLDLTGAGRLRVIYDAANHENGTVEFLDDSGAVTGSMTFANIETVIPCFTPGTRIRTEFGDRPVETLRLGDRIVTRDNGLQEIRWIGNKHLEASVLRAVPKLRPVFIRKGALGNNLPKRDMLLSPNHRMLIGNRNTALYLGENEVLVAAKHLIHNNGIKRLMVPEVSYIHFMFDRHEVVMSDGTWSESFQPGDQSLQGIDTDQRDEIFSLFPELKRADGIKAYQASRIVVRKHEARFVV